MYAQYDLSDPSDITMMHGEYDQYKENDWLEFLEFTELPENEKLFSYKKRKCLQRMAFKAGNFHRPSDKDILWGLTIIDKIESLKEEPE